MATVQTLLLFLNNAHDKQINHKKVQQSHFLKKKKKKPTDDLETILT